MSDELPPGSMNLEDDAPEPVAQEPAAPEPAPIAAEPAIPATDQDLQQAGGDKEKAGLLSALRAERERARVATERAQKADEYEAQLRTQQPYVQFLQANPSLMQPRAPEAPPAPPQADPDAVEAAQLMDFYKADGTLDIERGAKWLTIQDRRASRVTQAAVQPFHAQTAREKSMQNFAKALQTKNSAGQAPTEAALRAAWSMVPETDSADPNIAATLTLMAIGAQSMMKTAPPVPPPALVTEPMGGLPTRAAPMSAFEERLARSRGMQAQTWHERTAGFKQGEPTVLEND